MTIRGIICITLISRTSYLIHCKLKICIDSTENSRILKVKIPFYKNGKRAAAMGRAVCHGRTAQCGRGLYLGLCEGQLVAVQRENRHVFGFAMRSELRLSADWIALYLISAKSLVYAN